jgi:hypothetical protein
MITGKWADSAATLEDVIQFYETRFNLGLTEREKKDLIAFLGEF